MGNFMTPRLDQDHEQMLDECRRVMSKLIDCLMLDKRLKKSESIVKGDVYDATIRLSKPLFLYLKSLKEELAKFNYVFIEGKPYTAVHSPGEIRLTSIDE